MGGFPSIMAKLNDAEKRDFVSQIISLLNEKSTQLKEQGFDPTNKLKDLIKKTKLLTRSKLTNKLQQQVLKMLLPFRLRN